MSGTTTAWDDTLTNLHYQARNSKTARTLIEAAEREFHRLRIEAEARIADVNRKGADTTATLEEDLDQARDRADTAGRYADDLMEENRRISAELAERKTSRPELEVGDGRVQFRFTPHTVDGGRGYAFWRLDELESVITYLRVNGGVDVTVLRVDEREVVTSVEDPGYVPTPHKPPRQETPPAPRRPKPFRVRTDWAIFGTGIICGATIHSVAMLLTGVMP